MNKELSTVAHPRFNWYTGASLNKHSFESVRTIIGTPVLTSPSHSDSKTDIRSFAGFTFQPPAKRNFNFGIEARMLGRDLKDTQQNSDGFLGRMRIHDEKSLVVNVSKSNANKKIALTGFTGYSELDVTADGWDDANGNDEPDPGEGGVDNPLNTKRFKSLPGFTLGAGLSFLPSDHFTIRLEKDKTWYKAKSFSFADPNFTTTIKPRTKNTAIGLTYKW